jgi:hypothetical protein
MREALLLPEEQLRPCPRLNAVAEPAQPDCVYVRIILQGMNTKRKAESDTYEGKSDTYEGKSHHAKNGFKNIWDDGPEAIMGPSNVRPCRCRFLSQLIFSNVHIFSVVAIYVRVKD